jgi:flagellar biosynthesis anti-sigma factor FlgM
MSYANGIGSLQQALSSTTSAVAQPTSTSGTGTEVSDTVVSKEGQIDQASLSTTGGLMAQNLGDSDARLAKVASLQQAITSGNYNVSAQDVADKLIKDLMG